MFPPPISWDTAVSGAKNMREQDVQCPSPLPPTNLHTHTLHSHEELGASPPPSLGPRPEEPSPASSPSMGLEDGYVYEAEKRTVTLDVSN